MHPHSARVGAVRAVLAAIAAALVFSTSAPSATSPAPDIAANESAAIETLRRIAAAQEALAGSVAIETNCDGLGEYGYFAELAGTQPHRVSVSCGPAAGSPTDVLVPPRLGPSFGHVLHSCVEHEGYMFQMWLPFQTVAGTVPAIAEDAHGGKQAPPYPDPANGSRLWCCYAWPTRDGQTGERAFFVNQRGFVLQCRNGGMVPYDGNTKTPSFDEALQIVGDMGSPLRIGAAGGRDHTIWWPVP